MYMDEEVKKNPQRCKKRVSRRNPWKKSYYVLTIAANPENLFEIIETRQLFFGRYDRVDMDVVGLAADYTGAVEILRRILEEIWRTDPSFLPRSFFDRDDFI